MLQSGGAQLGPQPNGLRRLTPSYSLIMLLSEKDLKHRSSPHRLQAPHLQGPKDLRKLWRQLAPA